MPQTFSRRDILRRGAFASLAALAPEGLAFAVSGREPEIFKPTRIRIDCGLSRPFRALHLSDTHLSLMTDFERVQPDRDRIWKDRSSCWSKAERSFAESLAWAKRQRMPILHTGDLIDFVSEANLKKVDGIAADPDFYAVCGNHEWAYFMYSRTEDIRFNRAVFLPRMNDVYHNDLTASARVYGGVNFVSFDNWDYQVGERQDAFLRQEIGKKMPTVILCHCPFYCPKLHADELAHSQGRLSCLIGIPPAEHAKIVERNKTEIWRKPTERTIDFFRWIPEQTNVKAILCGHLHREHVEPFAGRIPQYVVGANVHGAGYEVEFS